MKAIWVHVILVVSAVGSVLGGELKAGAASLDITPELGTPMAGYYSERGAEGIHDPLRAKAIVLAVDSRKAALVSLDLISTLRSTVEEARRLIEQETDIPGENVMISATHSHTGPVLAGSRRYDAIGGANERAREFTRRLPRMIADAVKGANAKLEPVKVSFGVEKEEHLAFNRRFHMRDGSIGWNPGKFNPNIVRPAGPADPEVAVVYFEGEKNRPLATYVNFAMHLDTVGGTYFSADYPHALSEILGRARSPEMVTLFTIGCAGDVNHVNVNWRDPQKGPGEAARIGALLAAAALRTLQHLDTNVSARLNLSSEMVQLQLPRITPEKIEKAQAVVERLNAKARPAPAFMEQVQAFKVLDVQARAGKPLEVEVQVIALGRQIAWVSLPGEIFVELGLDIKAGSPFKQTIIAELANGAIGYIPTARAYAEGNYEVVSARCAQGSGEQLVESALRQLRAMFAAAN